MCHHTWLIFVYFVEMRFYYVAQASLELLSSSDPPSVASQSVGITSVSHRIWPTVVFIWDLWTLEMGLQAVVQSRGLRTWRLIFDKISFSEIVRPKYPHWNEFKRGKNSF